MLTALNPCKCAKLNDKEHENNRKDCSNPTAVYSNPTHHIAQYPLFSAPVKPWLPVKWATTPAHSSTVSPSKLSHQIFILSVQIKHSGSGFMLSALMGSRGAGNLIDQAFDELNLPTQPLQHPPYIQTLDCGPIGNGTVMLCTKPLMLQVSTLLPAHIMLHRYHKTSHSF